MTAPFRHLAALVVVLSAAVLPARPASAVWQQNGVAVCSAAGDQTRPVVLGDGQGGAYIVWEDARTLPPQVYAQHVNALGNPLWAEGGILVSSGFYSQSAPVAVGDGAGGVIIAWILELVPGARAAQGQRLNSAGAPLWAGGGIPMTPGAAFPVQLAIISDARLAIFQTPGVILAWTDIRSGITTDIYARAIDAAGVPRWDATVCTAVGEQADLVMVTDGVGSTLSNPRGAILAWRDWRVSPTDEDIYAQRLSAAGVPQWTANGLPVDARGSGAFEPVLVPAGGGTAIVAWPGPGVSRTYALWAQRVGTLGSWPNDGVQVAEPYVSQSTPAAIADGAGGILVSWAAPGPGSLRDILAQRLSSTGAPVWASTGSSVCDVAGNQLDPVVVFARAQGAVIAWEDLRTLTHSDIYAQLLNSAGVRQWNPDGVPLCTATGNQYDLAAAADTTGGAIVAWVDERSGGKDIYAQRITGWGGVVAVEPGLEPAPSLRLGPPFPNPTRGGLSFRYELPRASEVTAGVFDVGGRQVRTLLARQARLAGAHTVEWNGEDDGHVAVPPGVYWLLVRAGVEEGRRRAVVLR